MHPLDPGRRIDFADIEGVKSEAGGQMVIGAVAGWRGFTGA
jgi:hypothetical protein